MLFIFSKCGDCVAPSEGRRWERGCLWACGSGLRLSEFGLGYVVLHEVKNVYRKNIWHNYDILIFGHERERKKMSAFVDCLILFYF